MSKALLIIFFLCGSTIAQTNSVTFISDTSFKDGLLPLEDNWKIKNGDDKKWAEVSFNDSDWDSIYPSLDFEVNKKMKFTGRAWFRLHFFIDSTLSQVPLSFLVGQQGASEIYIDGKLIHALGKINQADEKKFSPGNFLLSLPILQNGEHILSVRYSNHNYKTFYQNYYESRAGFALILVKQDEAVGSILRLESLNYSLILALGIFFITLAFLHFLLYLFYRKQKTNLYYSIFVILLSGIFLTSAAAHQIHDPETVLKMRYYVFYFLPFFFCMLIGMLSFILFQKFVKAFWIMLAVIPLVLISKNIFSDRVSGLISFSYIFASVTIAFSLVIVALRRKKEGAKIIGTGALFFLLFLAFVIVRNMFGYGTFVRLELKTWTDVFLLVLMILSLMSIPLSMSVYLARDFAKTNRSLQSKLQEVEELSEKNLQQEKEKQKILESQKGELERQVTERTSEILNQKLLIEEKNKEVTDSIKYASRIQRALLTQEKYIDRILKKFN